MRFETVRPDSPLHSSVLARSFTNHCRHGLILLALLVLTCHSAVALTPPMPSSSSSHHIKKPVSKSRGLSTREPSHRYYHSKGTLDAPVIPSFEERMRKLVQPNNNKKRAAVVGTRRPSNVQEVVTLQDYQRLVGEQTDQLVVVRFYATWCKACRAVAPSFYKLARDLGDRVTFVEVPVTDTSAIIHQGLGVPSLPYAHVYHPEMGLVEELRLTRPRFADFARILESYVKGSCEIPNEDEEGKEESIGGLRP